MRTRKSFNKKILASAIASCALVGFGQQAYAQNENVDEVVITGVRAALISAMDTKRNASGVVEAINAEDIGKFPDTNMAESLQRVPGVSIDRQGGEGVFVTVRGFGAGYNITTLNGRQLSSENINRNFEFDTLGADMVSGLVVHKSGDAPSVSGGIGATIDIKTPRPLEVGNKISGGLKIGYETLGGETAPEGSVLVSHKFADDAFGVLFAYNHFERDSTVDRVTNNRWTRVPTSYYDPSQIKSNASADGYLFQPQNHFINVQYDRKTRDNANLVLQFAPSDQLTITADALYSEYELLRDQNMLVHWFGSRPSWRDIVADKNGTITHFIADKHEGEGAVQATEYNAIRENRKSDTLATGLNVKYELSDNFTVNADAFRSESNYKDPNGFGNAQVTMGYRNRLTWDMEGGFMPAISGFESSSGSDGRQTDANYAPTIPVGDYLDPTNLRPGYTSRTGRVVDDTITQFKLEGVYDSSESSGLVKSTFGFSSNSHEKSRENYDTVRDMTAAEKATQAEKFPDYQGNSLFCMFCGGEYYWTKITPPKITVLDAGSGFLSGVSKSGPVQTKWLKFDFDEFRKVYEGAVGVPFTTVKRPGDTFAVTEDINALYAQLEFAGDISGHNYNFVTGLRYEQTDVDIDGNLASLQTITKEGSEALYPKVTDVTPKTLKSSYDEFLPNIDFKIDLTDDVVARADYSKTITRPQIDALRPNLTFGNLKQGGPYPVTAGNPDLKPLESENIDLSVEWYYAKGSYASAGLFYKNVNNFIENATTGQTFNDETGKPAVDPSNGNVITFQVTSPSNVETAKVDGFEFAVQHMFGESGFGAVLNGTIVNTNAKFDVKKFDTTFALSGVSDSYNLVGFYENDKFQVRVAYNWRDEFYFQSLDSEPQFVKPYGQFDVGASYNLTDNITLTFDGINITDEVTQWRGRYKNQFLLAETSGPRYSLGVRASF